MNLAALDALVESGYPRPQLVRPAWEDLCGSWDFAFDDANVGLDQGWWRPGAGPFGRTITVPFPPESRASGVNDQGPHSVVWYRRRVELPQLSNGERIILHFGAVDYEASVFVDGKLVGAHQGGHTPFAFDVTPFAGLKEDVVIVVRAQDGSSAVHQPRGKQDWQERPHQIWYERTTGIWQPVWSEVVPREHVIGVELVPDIENALVTGRIDLAGDVWGACLGVPLSLGDELFAEHRQVVLDRHVRVSIPVPALENSWDWDRLQWSPSSPTLVSAEVSLTSQDRAHLDVVHSYLGFRSTGAVDRQFVLNGGPLLLKMVLSQGYWPDSHLAAPDRGAHRAEVELIKALGFNGARVHQKVEDPRFLYWCDRLGLMVWEDMPSAGAFSNRALGRLFREWMEVIERDRAHPCIVAWVPFNESWGIPAVAGRPKQRHAAVGAYHLTRALDPTRPVIANDGWEHAESDIWGVHDYAPTGDQLTERYGDPGAIMGTISERWPATRRVVLEGAQDRGQPNVLSEFGGISLVPEPGAGWHGYSNARSSEELAARLQDLFTAVLGCRGLAGYCYTQLTDTEQEANGLVYEDRKPKLPLARSREIVEGRRSAGPTM